MKKFLAIMLALMLALSAVTVAWAEEEEESGWVEFDASLTNYFTDEADFTDVSDWYATSYSRAMLTVLLLIDLKMTFDDSSDPVIQAMTENLTDAIDNTTYVGMGSPLLFVPFRFGDYTVSTYYSPFDGTAGYMISDLLDDDEIEYILYGSCDGNYLENTSSAIAEVLSDLQSDD